MRPTEPNPGEWRRGDFEAIGYLFEPDDSEASFRDPRNNVHRFRGATPDDLLETLRVFETRRAWFQLTPHERKDRNEGQLLRPATRAG